MLSGQLVAGRYRLEDEVGAGGMGVVWRATDVELGRVVALKRAHASGERPLREAKAAAALHHPNVVTLFDVVSDGGDRWLVMEYLPSRSLAELVGRRDGPNNPLPPAKVASIGAQLASALQSVHAAGTLHRDFKPGNVLITADGTAKLCDFGISRSEWDDPTLTGASILGTPAYLAPEVANGQPPTAASDLFSLGATLFYAVEGSSPYGPQDNPAELIRRAARGQVLAARRAGPLTPVLGAMLRRDPRRRPDVGQVVELFDQITMDERLASEPTQPRTRQATPVPRRRIAMIACAAAVVVIAATAFFVVRGTGGVDEAAGRQVTTAAAGMGDQRTADPCSLLDAPSLTRFGDGQLDSVYGNFDRCDILLENGNIKTDVAAVLDNTGIDASIAGTVQHEGALTIQRQPARSSECDREIGLPGNTKVVVYARKMSSDSPDGAPFCAIADAATQHALTVLRNGEIPRRTQPFPPNSVANKDACTLLPGSALGAIIPGVNADAPERKLGDWTCTWDSATSHDQVQISYDHNQPFTSADGTLLNFDGRKAVQLTPEAGDTDCMVWILNRIITDADGKPLWELVDVDVDGDQSMHQKCTNASLLARAVAPNLPG